MELKKPDRRYRKTEAIVLGVAMSALILTTCGDSANKRRCVDPKTGQVVESYKCEDDETSRRYGGGHGGYSGYSYYSWYYGGSGYYSGERVRGGSSTPPRSYSAPGISSVSHSSSGGIARGGFGGMASAHGGGSGS